MKKHLPIATALMLLALAGCQSKPSVVGKWKGKSVTGLPEAKTPEEKEQMKQVEQSVTQMEMEFKADGSATVGGGGAPSMKGNYTFANNQVSFKMDYSQFGGLPAGMAEPKPTIFNLSPDGKTLSMKGDLPGEVHLERVP